MPQVRQTRCFCSGKASCVNDVCYMCDFCMTHGIDLLFGDPLDAVCALEVHPPALAGDEDLVAAPARLDHAARPALAHVPLDHVQVPVARVGVRLVAEEAALPLAVLAVLVVLAWPTAGALRRVFAFAVVLLLRQIPCRWGHLSILLWKYVVMGLEIWVVKIDVIQRGR